MRTAALQASRQGAGLLVASPQGRSVHVAARKLIVCEGERQQQGEASTSQLAAPAAAPSVRVPGQQPQQRRPPPGPNGENTNVRVRAVCAVVGARVDDGQAAERSSLVVPTYSTTSLRPPPSSRPPARPLPMANWTHPPCLPTYLPTPHIAL